MELVLYPGKDHLSPKTRLQNRPQIPTEDERCSRQPEVKKGCVLLQGVLNENFVSELYPLLSLEVSISSWQMIILKQDGPDDHREVMLWECSSN